MEKFLITIVGPTGIGKTALAIQIAQKWNCEIISCDSRQFFRELPIGTAAPTPDELALAQHHFIHNKSITESYTVGDFERDALEQLDQLFRQNRLAVMVGGSGLYVDAVLKGLDEFPDIDTHIRDTLQAEYHQFGIVYLQQLLKEKDPEYFLEVDIQNPQRLLRALEVCIGTGQPFSSFRKGKRNRRNFTPIIIGLEAPREILYDRINRRVDLMMQQGLLAEAQSVYTYKEKNALQTVGYKEIFDFIDEKITLEEAVALIKQNSRRYAKRQITWFKRTQNIQWFDYSNPKAIIDSIDSQISY